MLKIKNKLKNWYHSEVTVNTVWYYTLLSLVVIDAAYWGLFSWT